MSTPPFRRRDALPTPEELGAALAAIGVRDVFTVADDATADLVEALSTHQVRYLIARRGAGIAAMATGYTQTGGRLAALLITTYDGLAIALPGIMDAVTSRTPLLVLRVHSHVHPTDRSLAEMMLLASIGVLARDLAAARLIERGIAEAARAAEEHRLPVVLRIVAPGRPLPPESREAGLMLNMPAVPVADAAVVEDLAGQLSRAHRPVFLAGRGATRDPAVLEALADRAGALLATSAAAHGLFTGNPWYVGIAGVLAPPGMAELLAAADMVVSWGCSLDTWTTRHGRLIAPDTRVAHIDINPAALGLHHRLDLGIAGDTARSAESLRQALPPRRTGYRTAPVRERIAHQSSWQDVGYLPIFAPGRIDPRTLSLLLDTILPAERTLIVELGAVMGSPISYLRVPDPDGFHLVPTHGLGLASGIGAALARPDRLAVTVVDIDSALTGAADLETAAQLHVPLLIVVYDDKDSTGDGSPPDLGLIAAGHGCPSAVIRCSADLTVVSEWLAGPHDHPLVLHAQVTRNNWWLDELAVSEGEL